MENSLTDNQAPNQLPNNQQSKANAFLLPPKFKVRLEMKSDWQIGTGAGRPGSIDKLLARDTEGFPFAPAKTVNGIWRDAMETLTHGLDDGTEGNWSKWVEAIFGIQPNQIDATDLDIRVRNDQDTYSYSLLSLQPARLSESLCNKIKAAKDQRLFNALTFIKPGVAIDEKTGTAITDFLRFEEMGRVGTVLEAECELRENNKTISALLILSAKLVERIGGKRRRGAGLCMLKVCDEHGKEIDAKDAIEWLDKNRNAGNTPSASDNEENFSLDKEANDGEWQTLEFSLKLQTPVSIVTATLGNVSESLDYIPGTYLLPHITKVLRKNLSGKVFQAVAYGDLQVLPATVEINGKRGLPVPRMLAQHKVDGGFEKQGTLYNKFANEIIDTTRQLKPFRTGYVQALESAESGKNKLPSYKNTSKSLLMHNTVKDEIQRPHEDVGGVYSREAIAARTILRGEIRLRKKLADELGANWWTELNDNVRLGTSRKDDYGSAVLKVWLKEQKAESENNDSPQGAYKAPSKTLTVYLASDVLLRNTNLRQTNLAKDLAKAICSELNKDISDESQKIRLEKKNSLIQTRRIESWHEGWGFPRPTLIAMEAGSCVVFEVVGNLTGDSLLKLEAKGIGERRGEGYGQMRFNPPLLIEKINSWEKADKPSDKQSQSSNQPNKLEGKEKEFAELIEETAWREELKVAVLKIADDKEQRNTIFGFNSEERTPPMSEVGGLRSAISRLNGKSDATIVTGWLDHLNDTENRRKKWADKEKAEDKIKRIKELIEQDSKVWLILCETKFGGINVWQSPPTLVRSKEELQKKLWAEAVRALFDACARAHKRELE